MEGSVAAEAVLEAARQGDLGTLRRLLEADPGLPAATDDQGQTVLHRAA